MSILFIATISGTFARARVLDRFDRLRHDAVVGRDDEHDDVGRLRAARAHRRERRVARRVEERDDALVGRLDVVRADVLRDAAGFARRDFRAADVVEQRRLAVIDVAHDRDDRRTRREIALIDFDAVCAAASFRPSVSVGLHDLVAEFFDDEHRGVVVDDLIDCCHHAHLEQCFDDFGALHRHLLGELGDRDRFADRDFAHDRRGRTRERMRRTRTRRFDLARFRFLAARATRAAFLRKMQFRAEITLGDAAFVDFGIARRHTVRAVLLLVTMRRLVVAASAVMTRTLGLFRGRCRRGWRVAARSSRRSLAWPALLLRLCALASSSAALRRASSDARSLASSS